MIAETPDGNGAMLTLDAATAEAKGKFTLTIELEKEGHYDVTLTASKEGMNDATLSGEIAYSAKTRPSPAWRRACLSPATRRRSPVRRWRAFSSSL